MLPAHIAVCIYIMTGKADASNTAPQAAGEPGSAPAPAPPAPVLSPSSDETTEAAMEDSAPAPSSPPADEEMPPVSVAAPAEGESGSGASSPPPEVRKWRSGILALKPARVLPGAEAEQIRKRPPLRPMDRAGSGGDLDIDAPAFPPVTAPVLLLFC